MLFNYEDLSESILYGDSNEELGLEFVESTDFVQDGKYQSKDTIFKYNSKFYIINETRSGSPFSDWNYEEQNLDENGMIDCDEVTRHKIITYEWR